jgi:hypothetical protein
MKKIFAFCLLCSVLALSSAAQRRQIFQEALGRQTGGNQPPANTGSRNGPGGSGVKKDSLGFERRDDRKDSTTVTYRLLDIPGYFAQDSTVNDIDRYFSVPSHYQFLGNNGNAAYSLIYTPNLKPGMDAGFHAYDIYRLKPEETRYYKTRKPYSQINYQLASGKEQMIRLLHTQNPKPNVGFGFDYKLVNAPGFFLSQNTNHTSYRLFGNYTGKRKRYALYTNLTGNTLRSGENGGIVNNDLLSDPNKKKRFSIPVNIGNNSSSEFNPFSTAIVAGNTYRDFTFFLRQQYDIGKKDSIAINDSTTEYLFYPKLRFQHSFSFSTARYNFADFFTDSAYYKNYYDTIFRKKIDTFSVADKWTTIINDFALVQFPETRNPGQFLQAGIRLENYTGNFRNSTRNYYNAVLYGLYRNKTRDKKWDIAARAEFYTAGFNNGDYLISATLDRYLGKKWGDVQLFFANVNRTPSFIFNALSAFNFKGNTLSKKENSLSFGAEANTSLIRLGFKNHLLTNLAYYARWDSAAQYTKVINLLQIYGSKTIRVSRRWNWYIDVTLQQTDGAAPVKVPLLFTRNRLAYEGVYFKNLNLSTGLELRYHSPFKAYSYSPVVGQFFPQDTTTVNNLPVIAAFLHFRIKSFSGFIRAENLNTMSFRDGFGFTNNNFATPNQPTQGLLIRFGIRWGFVN